MPEDIKHILERLTGEKPKLNRDKHPFENLFSDGKGLSFDQLNELLLYFGYGRIDKTFFDFLLKLVEKPKDTITSLENFSEIVQEFNIVSLLAYGNIKFAFKTLSWDKDKIKICTDLIKSKDMKCYIHRSPSIIDIEEIDEFKTIYLGEYIREEIIDKHKNEPDDPYWESEYNEMNRITPIGIKNNNTYLVSEHMDVYIATSMRERHEYVLVNQFIKDVFENPDIKELKLRKFDPTQAFCKNRVDKGLTEALMLKKADCTIYLAQETDTLGKDSELATTLAQGKPVIVYVPIGNKYYVNKLIRISEQIYKGKSRKEIITHLFSIFEPRVLWDPAKKELRNLIDRKDEESENLLYDEFCSIVKDKYKKRAEGLKEKHPLGIQINLNTGVANGVLVVRKVKDCVRLLRAIILNEYKLLLEPKKPKIGEDFVYLRETISKSIYRVMTNNTLLTNTFWNFYLVQTKPNSQLL